MSVLMTLGRWAAPGHTSAPERQGFGCTEGLQRHHDRAPEGPGTPSPTSISTSFGKADLFDKFRRISWNSGNTFHLRRRAFDQTRVPPFPTPDAPEPHDLVVRWADRTSHR